VASRARLPCVVVLAWLLLVLAGAPPLVDRAAAAEQFVGRVVGVTDGDTLVVLRDRRPIPVRLTAIDAPEKRQAFGQRAKQFTAGLAFDRRVTVRATGRDRNGRVLAEVLLPDGRSLNRELVRAGYAWWFRRYSRDPVMARLEAEARQGRRGLWADPAPVAPWEFRRRPAVPAAD
jgi:endonuclease YncB( thermonuclease family)